ncbi:MAG: (d)CMP kinase [Pirellulaceae bacterium]|nr:(d)CMP kinase [Planctomycetaceae bacterium]MDG1808086.1 (d)CMP kinase [Pirellulaceae bacterium]MDG2104858.1 (d)CMP kinase [Pirellulaceae bacterium]
MIITIDGPAGAGKSTVAKTLAKRLGFQYLDTGAMYRAIAWSLTESGVDLDDHDAVQRALQQIQLGMEHGRVFVNQVDVTDHLRDSRVSQNASRVATHPEVRERLVELQRVIASQGDFVCEGRDQGTVAFPDSPCKIFLTAAAEVRARRRWLEMKISEPELLLERVIEEQKIRDLRDETREIGRLERAHDAVEVDVGELTVEQVVETLESTFQKAMAKTQSES